MPVAIEIGSTNVYADLGYPDAEEMRRKASLAAEIARAIKTRHFTQEATCGLLGVDQAKITRITRGQFRDVSEARMHELVNCLT
jgi:predicted XRE-type DNA-binding protein